MGVPASDLRRAAAFYELLGFSFPPFDDGEQHVESTGPGARLMLDAAELLTGLLGEPPRPANHSAFAVGCATPAEVDAVAARVGGAGHAVTAPPWDAPWGQRYATVADPDGTRVDLFAPLPD